MSRHALLSLLAALLYTISLPPFGFAPAAFLVTAPLATLFLDPSRLLPPPRAWVLGLLFGMTSYTAVKKLPVHQSMAEVSELIYETCKAYLAKQGRFLLVLFAFWLLLSGVFTPFLVAAGLGAAIAVGALAWRMELADREGHPVHLTLGRFPTGPGWSRRSSSPAGRSRAS